MNNNDIIRKMVNDLGLTPRPSDLNDKLKKNLMGTLSTPSVTHTYSIITEFIKDWFIGRLPDNFFNHIHIEAKNIYDEYRRFDIRNVIKKNPPLLAIAPRIDLSFSRDMLDTNRFGADYLINTARIHQSYIRDYDRNCFIGSRMEQLSIDYDMRIMVETKAQQIDLYKHLALIFPLGHMTEENIYLDYHLPMDMMKQFAIDSGHELNDEGNIKDPMGFINYINSKSRLPIIYKYRTATGNLEFFMRVHDIDIMIDMTDMPNTDDGDRVGMKHKRYNIDLRIGVKAPTPKFFAYYSTNIHELIGIDAKDPNTIDDILIPINTFKLELVPKVNELGWNQYIFSEYVYDSEESLDDRLKIDLSPVFNKGDVSNVIANSLAMNVSPDNFINFKLYNGLQYLIDYEMDWNTCILTLHPENDLLGANTAISVYMDTEFIHESLTRIQRLDRTARYKVKEYSADKRKE